MRKQLLLPIILMFSLQSFSQTCEERETKLLASFNGISAGYLYNTFGLIGSISDGFTHEAYDGLSVSDLMKAQMLVADNLVNMLDDLKKGGFLKEKKDISYAEAMIHLLTGLKKQAQLLEVYADKKSRQNREAYEEQRKQNWTDISKLMGIAE